MRRMKRAPIAAASIAAFAGLWYLFGSVGADPIPHEIRAAAEASVGRVHVIDMQGRATPHANAFAIDTGVMLTTCEGFLANTQVVVKFGPRTASASLSRADAKRNLCRLAVVGAGSWPLGVNAGGGRPGERAYAASAGPAGETVLVPVKIVALLPMQGGQAMELSVSVEPTQSGGPLLDTQGRVIGVLATQHAFAGKSIALPGSWVQEIRSAPSAATR